MKMYIRTRRDRVASWCHVLAGRRRSGAMGAMAGEARLERSCKHDVAAVLCLGPSDLTAEHCVSSAF